MTRFSIAIPEDDIGWAESRVAAGEFASVDAYFSQLARRDRAEAEEQEWLEAELQKGLDSGVELRSSRQIFSDIRIKYLGENY